MVSDEHDAGDRGRPLFKSLERLFRGESSQSEDNTLEPVSTLVSSSSSPLESQSSWLECLSLAFRVLREEPRSGREDPARLQGGDEEQKQFCEGLPRLPGPFNPVRIDLLLFFMARSVLVFCCIAVLLGANGDGLE